MDLAVTLSLLTAFTMGAAHALEPGHGKTLVAAYLTGNQSTYRDALMLGVFVTIFHTLSVLLIGLVAVFLAGMFIQNESHLYQALQVLSGAIILGIGLLLFWRRFIQDENPGECECHFHHHHAEDHIDANQLKEKATSFKDIFTLGFASGVTPCPMAIAVLVASMTVGGFAKLPEALMMLFIFSLGLASVLVAVGLVLITSSEKLSNLLVAKNSKLPVYVSQFSTLFIIALGVYVIVNGLSGHELHLSQVFSLSEVASH